MRGGGGGSWCSGGGGPTLPTADDLAARLRGLRRSGGARSGACGEMHEWRRNSSSDGDTGASCTGSVLVRSDATSGTPPNSRSDVGDCDRARLEYELLLLALRLHSRDRCRDDALLGSVTGRPLVDGALTRPRWLAEPSAPAYRLLSCLGDRRRWLASRTRSLARLDGDLAPCPRPRLVLRLRLRLPLTLRLRVDLTAVRPLARRLSPPTTTPRAFAAGPEPAGGVGVGPRDGGSTTTTRRCSSSESGGGVRERKPSVSGRLMLLRRLVRIAPAPPPPPAPPFSTSCSHGARPFIDEAPLLGAVDSGSSWLLRKLVLLSRGHVVLYALTSGTSRNRTDLEPTSSLAPGSDVISRRRRLLRVGLSASRRLRSSSAAAAAAAAASSSSSRRGREVRGACCRESRSRPLRDSRPLWLVVRSRRRLLRLLSSGRGPRLERVLLGLLASVRALRLLRLVCDSISHSLSNCTGTGIGTGKVEEAWRLARRKKPTWTCSVQLLPSRPGQTQHSPVSSSAYTTGTAHNITQALDVQAAQHQGEGQVSLPAEFSPPLFEPKNGVPAVMHAAHRVILAQVVTELLVVDAAVTVFVDGLEDGVHVQLLTKHGVSCARRDGACAWQQILTSSGLKG